MAVKCLGPAAKNHILAAFRAEGKDAIDPSAIFWGRSRRTIIRVIEEAGFDPGITRRPRTQKAHMQPPLLTSAEIQEPNPALELALEECAVDRQERHPFPGFPVHPPLVNTPTIHSPLPWYRKIGQAMRQLFA